MQWFCVHFETKLLHVLVKQRRHTVTESDRHRNRSVCNCDHNISFLSCIWRLHIDAWMKSGPFVLRCINWRSASSPHTSKSVVTQLKLCPLTRQHAVNSKHTCWISLEVEFQHLINIIYPPFVLSFGSDWRLQTFSRSLCSGDVTQQVNSSVQNGLL